MAKTKAKPAADRQCRPGREHYVHFQNGLDGVGRLELWFGPFSYVHVMGTRLMVPDRSLAAGWTLARYEPDSEPDTEPGPWVLAKMAGKHAGKYMLSFAVSHGEPPDYAKISPVNWNV